MTTEHLRRALARAGAEAEQTPEAVQRSWPVDPQHPAPETRRGEPMLLVGGTEGVPPMELDEYDMAVLQGDADRAVTVALIALDHAGIIECGEELVHQLGASGSLDLDRLRTTKPTNLGEITRLRPIRPPDGPVHPIEQALYGAIVNTGASLGNLTQIRMASRSWPEVPAIHERLVGAGLLRANAERGGMTRACSRVLHRAFKDHPIPRGRQARRSVPLSAGLRRLVALYGDRILWDVDPALALALAVTHPTEIKSCSCGGCG